MTRRRKTRLNVARHGGELRGNSTDRKRRKMWLLETFGTGKTAPCTHCGKKLTYDTLTVDRIIPGYKGGRYRRGNIQPSCIGCNKQVYFDRTPEEEAMQKVFDDAIKHSARRNPKSRRSLKYKQTIRRWKTTKYKRRRAA